MKSSDNILLITHKQQSQDPACCDQYLQKETINNNEGEIYKPNNKYTTAEADPRRRRQLPAKI